MATEYIENGDTLTVNEGEEMMPEMPAMEEAPEEAAEETTEAPADMPSEAMPDAE